MIIIMNKVRTRKEGEWTVRSKGARPLQVVLRWAHPSGKLLKQTAKNKKKGDLQASKQGRKEENEK